MVDASTAGFNSIYGPLLTAAAGVFTTLLTLLVGWLQRKGADTRRISAIDEALKRVQLLEAWYRTRTTVAPHEVEESRTIVLRELDSAMQSVKALEVPIGALAVRIERENVVPELSWYRRWFLLYRPVDSLEGWLARTGFYLTELGVALNALSLIGDWFANHQLRGQALVMRFAELLGMIALSLLLRRFAIWAGEQQLQPAPESHQSETL